MSLGRENATATCFVDSFTKSIRKQGNDLSSYAFNGLRFKDKALLAIVFRVCVLSVLPFKPISLTCRRPRFFLRSQGRYEAYNPDGR